MEIHNNTLEYIDIAALDIALLSSDQKEAIMQDAKMDNEYIQLFRAVSKGANVDCSYAIQEDMLTWKGRIYVPKAMRKTVIKSEYDSKVTRHFGTDRTMELIC